MKFFRKNLNSNFVRICRIQISSQQRNQNIYPNHFYRIKYKLDNSYNPGRTSDLLDYTLDLYCATDILYFINHTYFYVKVTENNNNKYIDIAVPVPTYSTNITVDIDSVDDGSITFFCDPAIESEYTRLLTDGSNKNVMLNNGSAYQFMNSQTKVSLSKRKCRITEMSTNTVCFINGTELYNADNNLFTLTIDSSSDYGIIVKIVPKNNNFMLIENF